MDAAVVTLQKAARELHLAGAIEQTTYAHILSRLRSVADELTALERRAGQAKCDPVDFSALLRQAVTAAKAANGYAASLAVHLPEGIMVEGPASDLRDLVCSLIEYAFAAGCEAIEARLQGVHRAGQSRTVCATELVVRWSDLPDFLRRKAWDAVRVRGGEVSIVSEPETCRIRFTLPVERRQPEAQR
jgi:hypothetical protein